MKTCPFDIPSFIQSLMECPRVNSKMFSKLNHTSCNTRNSIKRCSTSIPHLSDTRCPHNVVQLVIAIIVNSLKFPSNFSFTNIGKEILEISPRITHGNPTSSIVLEGWIVGIKASLNHIDPSAISSCSRFSITRILSVLKWIFGGIREFRHSIGLSMFCKWRALSTINARCDCL